MPSKKGLMVAVFLLLLLPQSSYSDDCTYGPDTCIQGFVWREAFTGDHVCVTPETRSQAAEDNQNAESRKACTDCSYGPDTCIQGFVWREATSGDHVCVTPEVREQAAIDNSLADQRRDPNGGAYGPNTCLRDLSGAKLLQEILSV